MIVLLAWASTHKMDEMASESNIDLDVQLMYHTVCRKGSNVCT